MFDTYFEIEAGKVDTGYQEYKSSKGEDKLYAICKCKGRVPTGGLDCVRNPSKALAHTGQGYCIWYLPNGSHHCGHVNLKKDE
jgi:hypothetical protein